MQVKRLFITFVGLAIAGSLVAGCGRSGLDRRIVTGTVTYLGTPIEVGEIQFYPDGDTKGPQTGTQIENGKYRLDAKGGVPVGMHKVRIIGYMKTGRELTPGQKAMLPPDLQDSDVGSFVQYLPAKYNKQTELTATVEAGGGEQEHNFALTR